MAAPSRRRLSSPPCLKTQAWTSALVDGQLHLLKGVFLEDGYEVLVWDMCTMMEERVGQGQLTERMKRLNPNVEAPVSLILSHLSSLLQAPLTTYTQATPTAGGDPGKLLVVNGTLSGLPFTWQFQCTPAAIDTVQTHLIGPLLGALKELGRQKKELVSIIKRKDREIEDYKESGASVSRRHLLTAPFEEKAFDTEMALSQEFEDSVQNSTDVIVNEQFQILYRNIAMVTMLQETEEHTSAAVMSCDNSTGTGTEKLPPSFTSSPHSSPATTVIATDTSPVEDQELSRREALERRLEEERARGKKKKKRLM